MTSSQHQLSPVVVATDGGASPNPGPGGWAWVSAEGRSQAGSFAWGTNNIGELQAIYHALLAHRGQPLEVQYDSQYAANCITTWGPTWRRKGTTGKANQELIYEIIDLVASHGAPIVWTWVRGHNGHVLNEQADALASAQARKRDSTTGPIRALAPRT